MPDTPVVTTSTRGSVRTIRLDRPARMNSLDLNVKAQLLDALRTVADDPDVRAVVLTGSGRSFCVGQDLEEARSVTDGKAMADAVREQYNPLVRTLLTMPKPVVAAVNGVAAGAGMALALACDIRIAASSATFTTAFAAIGLSCDTGISWTLPRVAGRAVALDLLLRPRLLGSAEALGLGLVHQVLPDEEFEGAVRRVAAELAAGPTRAFAAMKTAVTLSSGPALDTALEREAEQIGLTGASEDHRTGLNAFLAKRQPAFTGR